MKRFLALALTALLFCACGAEAQISELSFAKVIGIDRADDGLTVCAVVMLPHKGEDQHCKVISASCDSLAEGLALLDAQSPDTVFFGHVSAVLFGEDMARGGILEAIDCMVRSPYFRFDLPLIAVKDRTAEDVLRAGCEQTPPLGEAIERLFHGDEQISHSGAVRFSQVADTLENPLQSVFLPYMTLEEGTPALSGLALFQDDRLAEFLDQRLSLGLNFLTDRVKYCVLSTEEAVMRVNRSRTRLTLENGVFRVRVEMQTEVLEASDQIESFDGGEWEKLNIQQSAIVEKMMADTVGHLKDLSCDAVGFGGCAVRAGDKQTGETWKGVFPLIAVEITVKAAANPDKTSGDPMRIEGAGA